MKNHASFPDNIDDVGDDIEDAARSFDMPQDVVDYFVDLLGVSPEKLIIVEGKVVNRDGEVVAEFDLETGKMLLTDYGEEAADRIARRELAKIADVTLDTRKVIRSAMQHQPKKKAVKKAVAKAAPKKHKKAPVKRRPPLQKIRAWERQTGKVWRDPVF